MLFGTAEEGVEPDGFQVWVPFAKGPSFALSIGFHYTNIATETLQLHCLVHVGRGIWRSTDQLSTFVLLEAHTQNSVPASMTDDLKPYGSLAEFESVTGVVRQGRSEAPDEMVCAGKAACEGDVRKG